MTLKRLAASVAASTTAALALIGLAATPAPAAPPGPVGGPIVLGSNLTKIAGYDIATDATNGTAYVGWISDGGTDLIATVHLCVLPPAATSCAGGIFSRDALDYPTAAGLHVVVTGPGNATLVWFHGTGTSKLGYATYAGGALSASADATVAAPSNGSLDDLQLGPDGQIWAVTEDASSSVSNTITVRDGLNSAPTSFSVPFPVSAAQLAFNGAQPIVAVSHGSQIGEPVRVTSGPAWSPLADVPGTWQVGHANDIVTTSSGARLVASIGDASYRPVSAAWTGSNFAGATPTGDVNPCTPSTHDLVSDGSGRVADVSNECGDITIANLADTRHAGVVRFPSGGTVAGGDPQIGTFANGSGWVAWGIQDSGGDLLRVTRVMLPAQQVTVTTKKKAGTVSLTGPQTCLPAVSVGQSVKAKAGKHWKAGKVTLTLDGHKIATPADIDGAALAAGSSHTLVATALFKHKATKKHGHHRTEVRGQARQAPKHGHHHGHHQPKPKKVRVTLTFRVC